MFKNYTNETFINVNEPMSSHIGSYLLYSYEDGKREIIYIADSRMFIVFSEYGSMNVKCASCEEPTLNNILNGFYTAKNTYVQLIKDITFDVNYSV